MKLIYRSLPPSHVVFMGVMWVDVMFLKIHFVGPIFILGGGFRFLNETVLSSFNQRNGKACPHQSASAGWVHIAIPHLSMDQWGNVDGGDFEWRWSFR